MRVTDAFAKAQTAAGISANRNRLNVLQERLTSGKRINRASDDPAGAEAVINLRTSQAAVEQFRRSADNANQKLSASDAALTAYEPLLERMRQIVAQGLSDTTTQEAKDALATELNALRERALSVANQKYADEFLFGGTRQIAPPFDPATGAPSTIQTAPQFVQLEPGANATAIGVTAETVFADANSTIFADLTAAAAALRGTSDAIADRQTLNNSINRLKIYSDNAHVAHAAIGAAMKTTEFAAERLAADSLAFESRADKIEAADFVETAMDLSATQNALDAVLQVAAKGRRSLFDFFG